MKKCPKCKATINKKAKFCGVCGFDFKEQKRKYVADFVVIFLVVFCLFIGALGYNIMFEKKNLQSLNISESFGDVNSNVLVYYDKANQKSHIDYYTDMKIQQWQKDYMKFYNHKNTDIITLELTCNNTTKKISPFDVQMNVGENLIISFVKPNSDMQDYIALKQCINTEHTQSFSYNSVVGFTSSERNQAKNNYLTAKRQKEIQQQQAALMRQYYNYYYGGGYYY